MEALHSQKSASCPHLCRPFAPGAVANPVIIHCTYDRAHMPDLHQVQAKGRELAIRNVGAAVLTPQFETATRVKRESVSALLSDEAPSSRIAKLGANNGGQEPPALCKLPHT